MDDYHQTIKMIPSGLYEHKGNYYFLVGVCRMHESTESEDDFIAYIPLRVEPEWKGTARIALRTFSDFVTNFTYVGLRLP